MALSTIAEYLISIVTAVTSYLYVCMHHDVHDLATTAHTLSCQVSYMCVTFVSTNCHSVSHWSCYGSCGCIIINSINNLRCG